MKIRMFTLPNCLTLANLVCGCGAVVFALGEGSRLDVAFWLVAAAAVFDFADGFVARLTGQYSEIGAELDSLADMVSFGVAPSAILWVIYGASQPLWSTTPVWLGWGLFAVAVFAALRLARFNVTKSGSSDFTGLPVPAPAIAIASLGWMWMQGGMAIPSEVVVVLAGVVCWLLVSNIRMFALKFSTFGWRGNELRYSFLAASAALMAIFGVGGIAYAVALYVVVSVVRHIMGVRRSKI